MYRLGPPLIWTIVFCVFLPYWALGQQGDFHAPTTISKEATAALAEYSLKGRNKLLPKPNDIEAWKAVQANMEKDFESAVEAAATKYQPQIIKRKMGGVSVLDVRPKGWKENKKVLVYTHGGAYTLFSATSTLGGVLPIANEAGLRVVTVDYTLAPHAKWDEITDQVISVIQALVKDGHPLANIAIYGDSAGGGLAAGAVLKMRDKGLGLPAAVVLWSPWSDITETGDTYSTLKNVDPLLSYSAALSNSADAYAAKKDQKNPYVSPVYGDYSKGFPPTLIQVGTKEIFLSNAVRLYQALDRAGIKVKLDPYEGMWHVFIAADSDLPESILARNKMKTFLESQLK
jgi:monoterpene epsilon-lactone hydrolase